MISLFILFYMIMSFYALAHRNSIQDSTGDFWLAFTKKYPALCAIIVVSLGIYIIATLSHYGL